MHQLTKLFSSIPPILWQVLCILLLSLIPFLWLQDGSVVIGHDTGYALLPVEHFQDRLQTWTERYGIGADQSFAVPGFFIHGLEALIYLFAGNDLSLSQRIVFSIYMAGMGLSMLACMRVFFPTLKDTSMPLIAAVFFSINHFVLQAWFIAERPKFALYIALPLVLLILHRMLSKKASVLIASIYTAVLFVICNGGGALPLYGAVFIAVALFIISRLWISRSLLTDLSRVVRFSIGTIVLSVFLQGFWLLPYLGFLQNSFASEVAKTGGIDGVLAWVETISKDTSYANLLRLQGIQEWYVNPYHTYGRLYFSSPILVLASFSFLGFVLFSLFSHERKDRPLIATILLIGLIGMLFAAGTHGPFGEFYVFLLRNLPGFIAFRTPFYKFAPLVWFSFSVLTAYGMQRLIVYGTQKFPRASHILPIVCIVCLLGYHFPFFTSRFFTYGPGKSTKVAVPAYVTEYGRWMNENSSKYSRTIVYPPISQLDFVDQRDWGYWSLSTVFSLLDRHSYLEATVAHTKEELQLITNIMDRIERRDDRWIDAAKLLGADSLVILDDRIVNGDKKSSTDETKEYLRSHKSLEQVQTFGKWTFYSMKEPGSAVSFSTSATVAILDDLRSITPTLSVLSRPTDAFLTEPLEEKFVTATIIRPDCAQCLLDPPLPFQPPDVRFDAPGLPLHARKLSSIAKERASLRNAEDRILFELKNSVLFLSYSRFLVGGEAAIPLRTQMWNSYAVILSALRQALDDYVALNQGLAVRNTLLQKAHSTIVLQQEELLSYLRLINDQNESRGYTAVLSSLASINSSIISNAFFSTVAQEKRFVLPTPKTGDYTIYLQPDSLSSIGPVHNASITAKMNSTNLYDGKISQGREWEPLGKVLVPAGDSNRLTLNDWFQKDIQLSSEVLAARQVAIRLDDPHGCRSFSLGRLEPGKYELETTLRSEEKSFSVDVFTLSPDDTKPLLPYWGTQLKLVAGVPLTARIPFYSTGSEKEVRFCDLYALKPQTLSLLALKISQISAPVVVATTNVSSPTLATRSARVLESSQVITTVEIDPGPAGVLTLHQRFSPLWKLRGIADSQHLRINGYANGWIIPAASEPQTLTISFVGQEAFHNGVRLSVLGGLFASGGYLYEVYRRKKNRQ